MAAVYVYSYNDRDAIAHLRGHEDALEHDKAGAIYRGGRPARPSGSRHKSIITSGVRESNCADQLALVLPVLVFCDTPRRGSSAANCCGAAPPSRLRIQKGGQLLHVGEVSLDLARFAVRKLIIVSMLPKGVRMAPASSCSASISTLIRSALEEAEG